MNSRYARRLQNPFDTSSDDTSSHSDTSDSSITSSSDDDVEVCVEPISKRRRNDSPLKNAKEPQLNWDLIVKANYRWTIQNFSKVCSTKTTKGKLESPDFTIGPNDQMKWRLQLYPNGTTEQNKNNASLYLVLVSSKEPKVKAAYKCWFIISKNQEIHGMKAEHTFSEGLSFGFDRFIKTNSILNMTSLQNDILTVACEITVSQDVKPSNKIKVVKDLEVLLDSGNYSDVALLVDGKRLKVHKYILAARSSVFAAMFKHDMKEKTENTVEIPDISYPVMQELLRFAYTGEVGDLDAVAKELLAAADKYAFEDLKVMCEKSLCKKMSVENVVEMLNFAELHNVEKLKEKALSFFVIKVKDVINTEAFKAVAETQPLLAQVICAMAQKQKS